MEAIHIPQIQPKYQLIKMIWTLLTFSLSSAFIKDDGLLELNDTHYADLIGDKEALVLFFDPICPSSSPAYEYFLQASKLLIPQDSFILCKLDMYFNTHIPSALKVQAGPALVYYKNNDSFIINQPMTYKNIVRLIETILNPRLKVLNADKVNEFFRPEYVSFVLVDDEKSKLSWKIGKSLIPNPAVNMAHIVSKELAGELKLNWGSFYAVNTYHGIKDELKEFSYENITEFVRKRNLHKALPLISAYDFVIEQGLPAVYVFRNESDGLSFAQVINETLPELDDFRIVFADLYTNIIFSRVIGLPATAQPALMLIEPVKNNLFKFVHSDKSITKHSILSLIQDWKQGKAQRYFKTSPEVEGELNGQSFKSLIENTVSDTLVHFFAPWCDHCKKMDEQLEKVVNNVTSVKVVWVNAEDNEVPEHVIDEYPTLKFFYPVTKKWSTFNDYKSADPKEELWERIVNFVKNSMKDKRVLKKTMKLTDL